jgi:hypothetical protein
MECLLQEGSFSLFPANWQDTSMTVLRNNDSGLSIIVSRGTIPTGLQLVVLIDYPRQLKALKWNYLRLMKLLNT